MCSRSKLETVQVDQTAVQLALRKADPSFQSVPDFGQYLYALESQRRGPSLGSSTAKVIEVGHYAIERQGHIVTPEFNPEFKSDMGQDIEITNRTWARSVVYRAADDLGRDTVRTWAAFDVFNQDFADLPDEDVEAGRNAIRAILKKDRAWKGN